MNRLLILLFLTFGLLSCKNNSKTDKPKNSSEAKSIYSENIESKFDILSEKDEIGYTYKSVESNFKKVSIQLEKFDVKQYFANIITTTKTSTSLEGQERNIKIRIKSFDNPAKTIIEINKDCDNIDLQNHTYKTVKYGCCGSLNHYEIFDYKNNQIIGGDGVIVSGFIPNSRLRIYVGFTRETNDSTILGTLNYSTTNNNKFTIKIKTNHENLKKCDEFYPKILFQTNNTSDKFDANENEYTLWSLDKIDNEYLINNLIIKFKLDCLDKKDFKFINVPIINGKPFGKGDKNQEITID